MALIKCKECGKEISDKANCCVHCGAPIEADAKSKGSLTIFRKKSFYCSDVALKISIDGEEKYRIKKSEEITIDDLSVGHHTISFKIPLYINTSIDIQINEGNNYFAFATSMTAPNKIKEVDYSNAKDKNNLSKSNDTTKESCICPKCGGTMTFQAVAERGMLSIIDGPFIFQNKKTKVYAVCQKCGYKKQK